MAESATPATALDRLTHPAPLRTGQGRLEPAPWLDGATRVVAFRVAGEPRIAAAGVGWLRVFDAHGRLLEEAAGTGGAYVLEAVDVDGDTRVELVIGRGMAREARDAPASLVVHHPGDLAATAQPIPLRETSRAQLVAAIADGAGGLYVAQFVSKYMVAIARARRSDAGWVTEPVDDIRIAFDLALGDVDGDGAIDLAVARPYGESVEAPGDVFVLRAPGERAPIPSTRGARAIAFVPPAADGGPAFVFADGWHREYARHAQALITVAEPAAGGGWRTRVIAHVRDRHGYDRVRLGDVDGDGVRDVIAAGHGPAIAVPLTGAPADAVTALGNPDAVDAFPIDLDGDGADEVIVVGPAPGIWRRTTSPSGG